ncbi:Ig-like domain-containing protein [Hymenobacter weizhouensis]|uniref:Ig-like domain-containing protein n=1 Tax=Hymenobacter sp. YIM 151500-1 TaxID=2987689 RepID=UPI002226881E|nr:Ig-like domain-containing protein [Hymenobacter sp. YIM 151500-1]UYZ62348.1 Ig-like domain-containing protein [Hymenobacter sp. YIM 151500-1]
MTASNTTITASFANPITSLTLTYQNTSGANDVGQQGIGINNMSWNAALPVANNVTNAATLASTAGQTDIDNPSATLDGGTVNSYTITQVPSANQGILYYNSTGTTYVAVAASQVLTAAQAASLQFDPASTFAGGNVQFRYTVTDDAGQTSASASAATFTIPIAAIAAPATCGVSYFDNTNSFSGLTAEYYTGYFNDNLSFFNSNTPKLRRVDAQVNFTTNTFGDLVASGAADNSVADPNNFSARYRGSIFIATAGTYTFDVFSDDASYMWIDGDALQAVPSLATAIVNNAGSHAPQSAPTKVAVNLSRGLHNILIFYGEGGGGNSVELRYFAAPAGSGITANSVVPSSVLCAGRSGLPPVANNITNTSTIFRTAGQTLISELDASDADGTIASYTIRTLPTAASGVLYYNTTGTTYAAVTVGQVLTLDQATSLRFDPAPNFVGNATFTYSATDNSGFESNSDATYTIPITDVVVTARNDSYEVPKNTAVTGNVILNDTEPSYAPLVASRVTNPANGTVTVNANGTYTYTPNTGYTGTDSFTYRVCSSVTTTQCATATVNLRIYDSGAACTSSTGPNLLENPEFTNGDTGFTSDYNYVSAAANAATTNGNRGLVPENTYAVDANANTYHQAFQGTDYDGTGRFLMINGSATIQRMYSQTITVQRNRYYTFSAYFNNLLPPGSANGLPEVGFVINGTGVSSTQVVQESPDRWVKYSSIWYSGNNTTAIFEIRNVSTVAGGNDLGIDHVYFGTCNVPPVANSDLRTTLPGTTVSFSATGNDVDGDGTLNLSSVDLDPAAANQQTSVVVSGKGTFTVDASGNVTFAPVPGFTGTASIPYTIIDNDGAISNPGTLTVTVQYPPIDLATTISASPTATVTAGQNLTYTVVATNNGPSVASNVRETVTLPAGLASNGNTVTFTINGAASTAPTYDNTTGVVTFPTIGTLASGSNTTYTIAVRAPGAGPITAVAAVVADNSDTNTANNTASTSVAVAPVYDVATTITGPTSVVSGNLATYTVATTNLNTTGALSPAPNVLQTVQLPTGLTNVFVSNNGTYNSSTGVVTFPVLASLPLGQTVLNTISFPATGAVTASATVVGNFGGTTNAGDISTANNARTATATSVTAATTASANLTATISTSTPSVNPNGTATITATVQNNGPSAATNVVQRIVLVPGLVAGSTLTGLPTGATYDTNTGIVTLATASSLAIGAQQTATLQFRVPASGVVLAATSVSSATSDPVAADNVASTKVTIGSVADISTALAGPATALAGQRMAYAVTTTNNSGALASNVMQTVSIPAGLTDVSVSGGGMYDAATGVVTFTLGALPAGSQQVNSISFSTASTGNILATASVGTTTLESSATNNRATVTTAVQSSVDVTVSVNGPASTPVFSPATYVVVTTNNGPNSAASVAPTLQLPAGLTVVSLPAGATYNSTTGLVTLASISNLASGISVVNSITVVMPDVAQLVAVAQASVSGTADRNLDNNQAGITTVSSTPTDQVADLSVTLTSSASTVAAGQPVTLTATFRNGTLDAAVNALPQLSLPAGLNIPAGNISNGGTYNATTGLVTWPTVASMATNASLSYTVIVPAPGSGTLAAAASITSSTSDSAPANNAATTSVVITAQADVTTVVSGPAVVTAGSTVTYSVVTLNNGPSAAANVVQQVTLPAGVTAANLPSGASQSGTVVTFATIASQAAGAAGQVTNTFTITAPNTNYAVVGNVSTATSETNSGNNSSTVNTTLFNQPPTALDVVNLLQVPQGNTAGQQNISPLSATDDGTVSSYAILPSSLPTTAQGIVYYNNGGTYTALPTTGAAVQLTTAQAATLRFDPAAGFAGNAFFTYTATDNLGSISAPALYTIPVAQDLNAVYAYTPQKGGTTSYNNNDVLAFVTDVNTLRAAASGSVYDATTGALLAGASNGLATTGTNATIPAATRTTLNNAGIDFNSTTGQFFVLNRLLLRAGTYTASVTTVDLNGGVTTQNVSITIGPRPLPVTLVAFQAQAAGSSAQLSWRTAQELNNDRFEVERSFDTRSFQAIGTVRGQGTTTATTTYSFTDADVAAKAQGHPVYYRLKQVDTDGTTHYSSVQVVSFTGQPVTAAATLYPNPATTATGATLNLTTLPAGTYQVTLTDAAGRLVQTLTVPNSLRVLPLETLPQGTYLVGIRGENYRTVLRLVKE